MTQSQQAGEERTLRVLLLDAPFAHYSCLLEFLILPETSCSYAIVQPIADKTSLHLESEGLAVLRKITSPVAPVVVIGPYRSGKSFLLNQLLGVGCGKEHHLLL
jgi:hypothetical protein